MLLVVTACTSVYTLLYIVYNMEYKFTAKDFNDLLDKELSDVISEAAGLSGIDIWESAEKLTFHNFMRNSAATKKDIAMCLTSAMKVIVTCRNMLSEGINKVDKMKDEHISFQKQIIDQQSEIITCKTEQLNAVQSTVKSELKSYSDAVQSSCSNGAVFTPEIVKEAVKCVVQEEDRNRNIMIYGVKEQEEDAVQTVVSDVFETIGEKPHLAECSRIGRVASGSVRPIKVTLSSADTVQRILRKSGLLKKSANMKTVFLAADRTKEERATRKELVNEMKQKRQNDSDNRYYLLGDKICCVTNKNKTG